jgi:hypothetical protein
MGAHAHPWAAGLHRRRIAAAQSVPLDCGCRDPWLCDCTENLFGRDGFDRWVEAGAAAARHLLARDLTPMLDGGTVRALWRRGADDRALAQHLFDLAGG